MVILAVTLVRVIVFKGAELHKVVVGSKMMGRSRRGIKAGDQGEAISNQWRGVGYWSCICVWERSHGELTVVSAADYVPSHAPKKE